MSLRKQIKTLIMLFVVLLLSFTVTAALLFRENFRYFDKNILDRSIEHVATLTHLAEIESGLYVFYDQLPCALTTNDDQCVQLIDSGRRLILEGFAALEETNVRQVPKWVSLPDFQTPKSREELKEFLTSYHEEQEDLLKGDPEAIDGKKLVTDDFQRLYYLVHLNAKKYVQNADKLLKEASALSVVDRPQTVSLTTEDEHLEEIYLGLYAVKDQYNRIFWENSRAQSRQFTKNSRNYLYAMMAASALLLAFAALIAALIGRHFRQQHQRDENLVILGTRDLVTGLFNRRSMEALLGQEIQRAKRRSYSLSLLMIRVEPYDSIKTQVGQVALDRLLFQISEALKSECRAYDGIFKVDKNSFLIVFPEADPKIINKLVARFRKKLSNKRFLVKSDQTKIQPTILLGAAGYPISGSDFNELVTFAEQTLSEKFDAKVIHERHDGVVSLPAEAPAAEAQQPSTTADMPKDISDAVLPATAPTPQATPAAAAPDDGFTFVPPGATAPAEVPAAAAPQAAAAPDDGFTFVPPGATVPAPTPQTTPAAAAVDDGFTFVAPGATAPTPAPQAAPTTVAPDDGFTFVPPGATAPAEVPTAAAPQDAAAQDDGFTFVPPGATAPAPTPQATPAAAAEDDGFTFVAPGATAPTPAPQAAPTTVAPDDGFTFVPPGATAPAEVPAAATAPDDGFTFVPPGATAPAPTTQATPAAAAVDDGFTFVAPGATAPTPSPQTTANAPAPIAPPEDDIPDIVSALLPPEETPQPSATPTAEAPLSLEDELAHELRADLSVTSPASTPAASNDPGKDKILVDLDDERQKLAEKFRRRKSTP